MLDVVENIENFKLLKEIIISAPSGILLVDQLGEICLTNNATDQMFGYSRRELLGQKVEILLPQKFRSQHPEHRANFIKNPTKRKMGEGRDLLGKRKNGEERDLLGKRKNGEEFPVEVGLIPVSMNNGRSVLASIIDISQRKTFESEIIAVNNELKATNKEMEEFVYAVSHDLKSPLVSGSSFLQFLEEDLENGRIDDVKDSLKEIKNAHTRMKNLIDDLLELSRIGQIDTTMEWVNPEEIIYSVIKEFRKIASNDVKINIGQLSSIYSNKKCFIQVIENLISNFVKYAIDVDKPQLDIFTSDKSDYTDLCIKDNGPGVEKKFHGKIFQLFQRVNTSCDGSGLGLAIVARGMRKQGGRVWIVSELGKGSEFWLRFKKLR